MKLIAVGAPHTGPAGWVMELRAKGMSPQNADCQDTRFVEVGAKVGISAIVVDGSMRAKARSGCGCNHHRNCRLKSSELGL